MSRARPISTRYSLNRNRIKDKTRQQFKGSGELSASDWTRGAVMAMAKAGSSAEAAIDCRFVTVTRIGWSLQLRQVG